MARLLVVNGASIVDTVFERNSSYAPNGAENFRRLSLSRGYDIPVISYAAGGRTVAESELEIATIEATHGASDFDFFTHTGGNDLSSAGNYPGNWDAAELLAFQTDFQSYLDAASATSAANVLQANITYRTNVSGGGALNTDEVEPRIASTLGASNLVDWYQASFDDATSGSGYFVDSIHPDDGGAIALQNALIDFYAGLGLAEPATMADQILVSFEGGAYGAIPSLINPDANATFPGQTGLMETGASVTLAGRQGGSPSTIDTNNYLLEPSNQGLNEWSSFSNSGMTIDVDVPASWVGADIELTLVGNRQGSAGQRDTDVTMAGDTRTIDPASAAAADRETTFALTVESTSLPQISLAGSGSSGYAYVAAIVINKLTDTTVSAGLTKAATQSITKRLT